MQLQLSQPEVAVLDRWRNDIDRNFDSFETWDEFVDFVHECQEGLLDSEDERWVQREACRIVHNGFQIFSEVDFPHVVIPDNYPRSYHGRYGEAFRQSSRSIESILRDEIGASGYGEVLIRDLDQDPIP